jgi:hypothetical protein
MRIAMLILLLISGLGRSMLNRPPAGTANVPGMRNVFLDKTEVTNRQYRFYLQQLDKTEDTAAYFAALPDTAVWHLAYDGHFSDGDNYAEYPVVGVSFQQAQDFCVWRSEYVSGRENRKIVYRLPEMKVFELTQAGQNANKVAEGLYSTDLGFRTFLGLCDNAAEMTSSKGKAIRGYERTECLETYAYYVPSHRLGFRCMAGFN